ncbi:MAG: efflux RND transporter periplasmic adaptor subunit, partial [Acidobacteria bacterium]|nr:efflux RND transporter periplasmic adaptor subunit [Acidobacteriota bacterium]
MMSTHTKKKLVAIAAFAAVSGAVAVAWNPVGERLAAWAKPAAAAPAPQSASGQKDLYYCPMHPAFTSDRPTECPVCTMRMVKREQPEQHAASPAAANARTGKRRILYYQDPMHPQYRSDKPGIAPDCGMKLVPVYAEEAGAAATSPGTVQISAAR